MVLICQDSATQKGAVSMIQLSHLTIQAEVAAWHETAAGLSSAE
jgi:hypothetical protein